ncbi:MAG: hypothetical protein MJ195_03025 [Mycoplasmoidaceae bacterium]|nr:hypothetical protein [Mycoplasmoidaceae bacterium]
MFGISFFCPNFIFSNSKASYSSFIAAFIHSNNVGLKAAAILNCISTSVLVILGILGGWIFVRYFICSIIYEK